MNGGQWDLRPDEAAHRRYLAIADELMPVFAKRASQHDIENCPHGDNFRDLHQSGLLAATASLGSGGLGLGWGDSADPLPLWLITKSFARADLAMARNWENHCNMLETIGVIGTSAQAQRYGEMVAADGRVICQWSAEPPPRPDLGAPANWADRVDGGWLLNGTKHYANSARLADVASVWMRASGSASFNDGMVMFMTPVRRAEIVIDASWWDPMGMRAADAQRVRIDQLFVADADQIGAPGAFVRKPLMTVRAMPHYAVSMLGAAEAMYAWIVDYLKQCGRTGDPFVQRYVGEMWSALDAANAYLLRVAAAWRRGVADEVRQVSLSFRHMVEHVALTVANHAIRAGGSTIFLRQHPFERMFRDLNVYVRHESDDKLSVAVGMLGLGLRHNSFWNPLTEPDNAPAAPSPVADQRVQHA